MFQRQKSYIIGVLLISFSLFIICSFGPPLLLLISGLPKMNGLIHFLSRLLIWGSLVFLFFYTHYFEKQKLLIWTEKKYSLLFYILSIIIIYLITKIVGIAIQTILNASNFNQTSSKTLGFVELFKTNIPLLMFSVLTAAVVEELVFRGYIQPRLEAIFKSPALAILISSLIFGIMHLSYGTLGQFLSPFSIGIICSWFYWKYRNLKILILFHFLFDMFSFFVIIKSH